MSLMSLFGCKQETIQLRVACLRKLPWKDLINYDKTKVSVFSQFSVRNFILESLMDKLFQGMIHCGRYDQTLTSPVICAGVPIGLHCDHTIDQIFCLESNGNQTYLEPNGNNWDKTGSGK